MTLDLVKELCGGTLDSKYVGEIWKKKGFMNYTSYDLSKKCLVHPSIWEKCNDEDIIKRFHHIYLFLQTKPFFGFNGENYKFCFYCGDASSMKYFSHPQAKDIIELMKDYPTTFMDTMERSLLNLSREYNTYGMKISKGNRELYHLLYCSILNEIEGKLKLLVNLGYLNCTMENTFDEYYSISANGWIRISELEHEESTKQGFIAMAFKDDTKLISDTFKKVIDKCGYIPKRIDEKEHNKQIVPEILFEISRSKFVVVDITYPNYGAYYEAGYAEALGKEVIICCREEEFKGANKPHFDIAQKSTVVWKDEVDLEERLYKRIEATVGLNQ